MMSLIPMGLQGLPVGPIFGGFPGTVQRNSTIIDAAGESVSIIGQILLASGPGTSRTFSAAGGGTITWVNETAVTWANAGTTVRVGVQGVSGGLENGSWSVYGEQVGNDGALSLTALTTTALSSGSMTLTHGALIAVVIEMTAKAGSDLIRPQRLDSSSNFPGSAIDIGAGVGKQTSGALAVVLSCDDGTLATFGELYVPNVASLTSFNSGSTPDEYAFVFSLPFTATTATLAGQIGETDTGETGELILYRDPTSAAPVVIEAVALDPDNAAVTANAVGVTFAALSARVTLEAHATYAVAYRPTSVGSRHVQRRTIGSSTWLSLTWLGSRQWGGERTNQSGAFATSQTVFPALGCLLDGLDIALPAPRTRPLRTL